MKLSLIILISLIYSGCLTACESDPDVMPADEAADASPMGGTPATGGAGDATEGPPDGDVLTEPGSRLSAPEVHRPEAAACDRERPEDPFDASGLEGDQPGVMCLSHADCDAGVNGRCVHTRFGTECTYDDCFTDSDCADDEVCTCGGTPGLPHGNNVCLQAWCRLDSDCGAGRYCSPNVYGCELVGWVCHTPQDTCSTQNDCEDTESPEGSFCGYSNGDSRWMCISASTCAG
ncbi:MAG: hypothetical protein ACE366_18665 [Bradymonadia bacterium]